MIAKKIKPGNIEEYIQMAPWQVQEKLHKMHESIREAAPGAKEGLKWGMPAYSHERILVTFAIFRHHIGFYSTPSAMKAFAKSISKFKSAKGSIQFPLDKPLPLSLISKITKFRVRESIEDDVKWKA